MDFRPMRPQIELQRVHDLLMTVLSTPQLLALAPTQLQRPLAMASDCLCWALHHDSSEKGSHASEFAALIKELEERIETVFDIAWTEWPEQEYNIVSADED